MWNVKFAFTPTFFWKTCINRNIVECKVKYCEMKRLYVHCINRNIVECKGDCGSESFVRVPCINRNIVECKVEVYNVADLVRLRINRNIVECKAWTVPLLVIINQKVLIETLWNVKSGLLWPVLSVPASINRNIMECQRSRTIFYIGILPHFPP